MQLVQVQLQIVEGKNDLPENYTRCSDGNVSIADIILGIFKSKSQRVKVSDIRNTMIPIPRHATVRLLHQCRVTVYHFQKNYKYYLYLLAIKLNSRNEKEEEDNDLLCSI